MNNFIGPLEIKEESKLKEWDSLYENDTYKVYVRDVIVIKTFKAKWLAIKRKDKKPIHDWEDIQEIKNLIVGKNNMGFELYPPESEVYNISNTYHIFVFENESIRVPIKLETK